MLWIEIGAGRIPVIYTAEKRRYLVKPRELLKCYMFRCKADALQKLKNTPYKYEFAEIIRTALLEMPTIPEVRHVERRKAKRHVAFNRAAFNPHEKRNHVHRHTDL